MHPTFRVLEVTQRYPPALGGVERHVERLAFELERSGSRVEIATTDLIRDRPFERYAPGSLADPPSVHRWRAYRLIEAPHGLGIVGPGLAAEVLRSKADIVHLHAFGYFPTWLGSLARIRGRAGVVITPHADEGTGTPRSRTYAQAVARLTVRWADRVIALTLREAGYLAHLGVDPERVAVIPNGIDLAEFRSQEPPARGPAIRILYVGRIYPVQKGLDVLVEAVARLPRSVPVEVRIVGQDWGATATLREQARSLGVLERIEFVGAVPRSDLLEAYRWADLLVVPSRFEPFGIVLLEGMASGLPIVASRVGGIPEVVEEDGNALLVPPGDPGALAAALERLASDEELRARFAARGRELVEKFDWPRLVPQFLSVFSAARGERR